MTESIYKPLEINDDEVYLPKNNIPWWVLPKYRFNDLKLMEYYEFFKSDPRCIEGRKNIPVYKSVYQYAHDLEVETNPELIEIKRNTLNVLAEDFLNYYDIDADYHATFFCTPGDAMFKWHRDPPASRWTSPTCNMMYAIGDSRRSPLNFRVRMDTDDCEHRTVDYYKTIVFPPNIPHRVDNMGYPDRISFRFPVYTTSYEYVYDQIRKKDESTDVI